MNNSSNFAMLKSAEWKFWLGWIALSTIGSLLGIVAGFFVTLLTGGFGSNGFPFGWTVVWVILGCFQWLLLKRRIKRSSLWIAASAIGGAVALPVCVLASYSISTNALSDFFSDFISLDLSNSYELFSLSKIGAINEAIVGTAQWLLLKRQISRAGWWIPVSALGGAMILPPISAAIKGLALVLMFRQTTSKPDSYIEQ
ncbi:hypothetical protein [Coleofasciculus sp. FACHB-501]|uniref:hypothetical protein n=1 Tax=Cyanophyceae TaxID=3028117 RepID=UPI0016873290|nr:hypothetical protein [Coleofasciculus sp. FACHB-501]MBD1840251.1 hypothetical protein [Coleofasciculus sp. FACHB-501]